MCSKCPLYLAIFVVTGNVGGLKGYIGIGTTIGELRTVGGVPIFYW